MTINELIRKLNTEPGHIDFAEVIDTIENAYHYTPTCFRNGTGNKAVINEAGCNEGSCKILSFGKINNLNEQQTLACFGKYYREDVLNHPNHDDHANIRNFILQGWQGIRFEGDALSPKDS